MKRWAGDSVLLLGLLCIVVAAVLAGWPGIIGLAGMALVAMAIFAKGD